MDMLEALKPVCDVEGALRRFCNNRALLERYVTQFPRDAAYRKLCEAMARGDLSAAENQAHTIKGIAANLGFIDLCEKAAALMGGLRGRGPAEEQFARLQAAYREVVRAIGNID